MNLSERIELINGDITKITADAIVNAANNSLLGGGGVDGAIHRAAGPQLLDECRTLNGCPTGQAKITRGYNLPARYVIHTVGPVWAEDKKQEKKLLTSCYQNCLAIATKQKLLTIAFPNISTGVYRFPKNIAAEIAVRTVFSYLQKNKIPEKVFFICFDNENYCIYRQMLQNFN